MQELFIEIMPSKGIVSLELLIRILRWSNNNVHAEKLTKLMIELDQVIISVLTVFAELEIMIIISFCWNH